MVSIVGLMAASFAKSEEIDKKERCKGWTTEWADKEAEPVG
jgi:hypothetical protein